jgi:hypothetical protein
MRDGLVRAGCCALKPKAVSHMLVIGCGEKFSVGACGRVTLTTGGCRTPSSPHLNNVRGSREFRRRDGVCFLSVVGLSSPARGVTQLVGSSSGCDLRRLRSRLEGARIGFRAARSDARIKSRPRAERNAHARPLAARGSRRAWWCRRPACSRPRCGLRARRRCRGKSTAPAPYRHQHPWS